MKQAVVIYPHQLFIDTVVLTKAVQNSWPIYLVEEPLLFTHNPIHRQKLIFHKVSMDAYETYLKKAGHQVIRLSITDYKTTSGVFDRIIGDGVSTVHITDTTDNYLERGIAASGLTRIWYESPLFILERADAIQRYKNSNRFMASFYKQLRKDTHILLDEAGQPLGGKWSFDDENRKKIPRGTDLPDDISMVHNSDIEAAIVWAETVAAEQYGDAGCWLPYTHTGAQKFLKEFLRTRFSSFGSYEDAMTTRSVRLWHSTLSPLLNVGLLQPRTVLDAALTYARENDVPLNSLEGFVRQILGWREFVRASYECDGSNMRNQNFFKHTRALPPNFWDGTTGLMPADHVIKTSLKYGYTHHIERLMIMGNFMLLTQTSPHAVYRWFMGVYVDAYDWVMVPNVYGMSQFADGGSFATKPYISGANYIKKMSDYPRGDWEDTWTALYWNFINNHQQFFASNHRLSMMPRTLERMAPEKRATYLSRARGYFNDL